MVLCMSRAHSPTFPSLHLRHNSFCNPSVALPTSQLILQPIFRFCYVTSSSLNSPGEPPMVLCGIYYECSFVQWVKLIKFNNNDSGSDNGCCSGGNISYAISIHIRCDTFIQAAENRQRSGDTGQRNHFTRGNISHLGKKRATSAKTIFLGHLQLKP